MPKKTKKKKTLRNDDETPRHDPVMPEKFEPPPPPRDKLIKLLTTHEVGEKELFGYKVSTRALEQLSPQEIKDLRVVFDAFDNNHKALIGPSELRKAMRCLGFKVSREKAKQLANENSLKGKGFIDFNEFLDIIIDQQGDERDIYDEISQGFKLFDTENTNQISMDNLKQACIVTGLKFSKQELEEMMIEADINGDGLIDKEEFTKIMLQTNLF